MPLLTDLPDELLVEIIERVRVTSAKALPDIGATCKKLRRISQPLQWKHVVLPWRLNKNSPIARFIKAHVGNQSILSLRLQPQRGILNAFRVGMKNAHDHLEALCECLHSLSGLSTFSISLDNLVDSRCSMPGPVLARIVRALPNSLRHLELDTECLDRVWEDKAVENTDDHLCLAISNHIPYLESLYVRLSCICIEMFHSLSSSTSTQTTSSLRRAFIRLDTSPGIERNLGVSDVVQNCKSALKTSGRVQADTRPRLHWDIYDHLLSLESAGAFPQLQRFILYAWAAEDRGSARHFVVLRDIATRSITRYPKRNLEVSENLRLPELMELNRYEGTLYVILDHDRQQLYGRRKDLEKALLYEISWTETQGGIRLPPTGQLYSKEMRLCGDSLLSRTIVEERKREHYGSDRGVLRSIEGPLYARGVIVQQV
jgi:hypothetical protein